MLKIAVCDDDEKICNLLENYINDSCRILHIEAETESFISGKVLKRKLREGENYQIYFLDIELADKLYDRYQTPCANPPFSK